MVMKTEWTVDGIVGDEKYLPDMINTNTKKK
jgi:hypothetical protein